MKNPNMKILKNSLQKVLGSANNEDFFDVTSDKNEEENLNEEVEEITEDEVNEAMNEEENQDGGSDTSDDSNNDVETEITIDEGEEINDDDSDNDDSDNDDDDGSIENSMDEENQDDNSGDENNNDDTSIVEDDENDNDGDFSDDAQPEISEEDIVEVNNIEEDEGEPSEEDNVVEVNDVQEVTDDDMDGISDDDFTNIDDDDVDNASDEVNDDIENNDDSDNTEIEISDEDINNFEEDNNEDNNGDEADSSANITIDNVATGSASELLASHGYQFETDACGKLCITGCDESENNVEVVEEVPDDIQIAPSDVNLVLHESASQDPFYSVLIKGKPVASIHLKDQEENEDDNKRNFFISSDYPKALTDAMVKGGVNSVLDSVNAKRFVASVKNSALAQAMKLEAKKEMEEEVKASIINAKEKFIESVKVALAGMNKNFFNTENDMKGAVYSAFANFGAAKDVALKETEKVFAQADSFFNAVVDKAQELMGFDEQSFKTVASAISTSGVGNREVETFESKLVKGNNPVVASSFANAEEKVTASATSHKKLTFKKHIS